jgi:hypothetical protein
MCCPFRSSLMLYIHCSCTYTTEIKVQEFWKDLRPEIAVYDKAHPSSPTDTALSRDRHADEHDDMNTSASQHHVGLISGQMGLPYGSVDNINNDNNTNNDRSEGCEYALSTVTALVCCL